MTTFKKMSWLENRVPEMRGEGRRSEGKKPEKRKGPED
jgi:hypothetical protein